MVQCYNVAQTTKYFDDYFEYQRKLVYVVST